MRMRSSFRWIWLASVSLLAGVVVGGANMTWAQAAAASLLEAKIAREVNAIHAAETKGDSEAERGAMWGMLGSDYQESVQPLQAEVAYTKALGLLKKVPEGNANYATVLDNMGSLYMQLGRLGEAEALRQRALEIRKEAGDGLAIAMSEGHVAEVEVARHKFDAAARDARLAMAALAAADDPDVSDRLAVMVTLIYALCSEKHCDEGLRVAHEASRIAVMGFQPDSLPMGQTLLAVGYAQWRSGAASEAEQSIRHGLDALRHAAASGSPAMLSALAEYRAFLGSERREAEMAAVEREIEAARGQTAAGCLECTVSAFALMPRRR